MSIDFSKNLVRLLVVVFFVATMFYAFQVHAATGIAKQIPFTGTLNNSSGSALSGTYDMVFKIYDAATGGTTLWTGTYTAANGNPVTVSGGVFQVLLGSGTGNTLNLDFNSDSYYLGITIESDTEMSPRTRLGATGYAFNADTVDGYHALDFLRGSSTGRIEAASAASLFTLIQNGAGNIVDFYDGASLVFRIDGAGVVTASKLHASGAFYDSATSTGSLGMVLQSTGTSTRWVATSTLGLGGGGSATLAGLTDTTLSAPSSGQLLQYNGSAWVNAATSTLGIAVADLVGSTDSLAEGSTNLYFTNARADARIAATTSLPNITALSNLATVGTITSGVWNGTAIDISANTNLGVSATGLGMSGDTLVLTAGYNIPLTASTTNWNTFFDTPSTQIVGGSGLSWSGNTLNLDTNFGPSIDESELNIAGSPTDAYLLQASSTAAGGFAWVATSTLGLGGSGGGTVSSVALSAPSSFSVSGSPVTTSGTLALSYAAGYEGLLTASSTNWNTFYNTPSNRIAAGTGLAWTSNTLNAEVQSSDLLNYLSLTAWNATTTDALAEGVANLYFTNARADARIAATTSLPNITALSNLATVGTITSGVWNGTAITDTYVSDTLTVGPSGSVSDSALSANVSLLGNSINESELNIAGSPTDAYLLQASSTAAGGFAWVATSTLGLGGSGGSSTFIGLSDTPSSFTANQILYQNASAVIGSNSFVFNGTNVGVGTSSPWARLSVADTSGKALFASGIGTIDNIEAIPLNIRYANRVYPTTVGTSSESAALYLRVDPVGVNNQQFGIYGEVTSEQQDTEGGFSKVVHYGSGDANYTAVFSTGYGYEGAIFSDGGHGFLGSIQATNTANAQPFVALWENSTIPAYGSFFASESPARGLTIQKYATSSPAGYEQIRVVEHDLARNRFAVYNDGNVFLSSLTATSGDPINDSPDLKLLGSYYNYGNATSYDMAALLRNVVTGTSTQELRFLLGTSTSETIAAILRSNQFDLQGNDLVSVGNGTFTGSLTVDANTLYVDALNNAVGIGTTSPASKLDVWGDLRVGTTSTPLLYVGTQLQNDNQYGRVGIGTSTPDAKLHVYTGASGANANSLADDIVIEGDSNTGVSILSPDANSGSIYFGTPTDVIGAQIIWDYTSKLFTIGSAQVGADMVFNSNNGAERLRITAAGDVGIGTSSPNAKLTVAGNVNVVGSIDTAGDININDGSSGLSILGTRVLYASTTNNSVLLGRQAGMALTSTGIYNTAIGESALRSATSTNANTAIGFSALRDNVGTNNTALGTFALYLNTTGNDNTSLGNNALYKNTSGSANVAIGRGALFANTVANNNVAIGYSALGNATSSVQNVVIGSTAGLDMANITSSGNNTLIGFNTGRGIVTGINNTIIGGNVTGLSATLSDSVIIADGQGNQRIRINSVGDVGIGTTSPASKLDVWGDFRVGTSSAPTLFTNTTGDYVSIGTSTQLLGTKLSVIGTIYSSQLLVADGNINTNGIVFDNSSNTGIEYQSSLLSFVHSNTNQFSVGNGYLQGSGGNGAIRIGRNPGSAASPAYTFKTWTDTGIYAPADDTLTLVTLGTDRVTLTSTGNFGIGTTSPASKLDVWGDLRVGTSSTPLLFADAAAGRIGVGTTTPTTKLQVIGDIRVGTSGTNGCVERFDGTAIAGTCTSDERLKTNIHPLSDSSRTYLESLVALTPVSYSWNETAADIYKKHTDTRAIGFIAQDVAESFPELVSQNTEGFLQVDFSSLPIYAIQAIKEMWQTVTGNQEKIATLEERIATLEEKAGIKYTPTPSSSDTDTNTLETATTDTFNATSTSDSDVTSTSTPSTNDATASSSDSDTAVTSSGSEDTASTSESSESNEGTSTTTDTEPSDDGGNTTTQTPTLSEEGGHEASTEDDETVSVVTNDDTNQNEPTDQTVTDSTPETPPPTETETTPAVEQTPPNQTDNTL